KITPDGNISTIAGDGTAGCGGDGGKATAAELNYPEGVAVDNAGNVFIADSRNQCIRRIDANGIISTIAGNGPPATNPFTPPPTCPGSANPIDYPQHLVADPAGNVLACTVLRGSPYTLHVLKITPAGTVSTVAVVNNPSGFTCGVTLDGAGDIFYSTINQVFEITPDGRTSLVAGSGASVGSGTGDGGPATATTGSPSGLAVDAAGNLLISGNRIRRVSPDGIISTINPNGAGALNGAFGDFGPVQFASFYGVAGIALDSAGNLLVADPDSARI